MRISVINLISVAQPQKLKKKQVMGKQSTYWRDWVMDFSRAWRE